MISYFTTYSFVYGFFIALVVLCGCQQENIWKAEAEALLQQSAYLESHHAFLSERIDSLWDATTNVIADGLPSDFPSVDRDIFLHSRNADHIRMFMSFKTLSPEVQSTVNAAAQYDAMLASQIRELQIKLQDFEKQKNQFLMTVAGQDAGASKKFADQFMAMRRPIK